MENITILESDYCQSQKSIIRSESSSPELLKKSIFNLGEEFAKTITEKYDLKQKTIRTPMSHTIEALLPKYSRSVIITTKDDFESLGMGLNNKLENSLLGYMDFEGRRGAAALDSPIRNIDLPNSTDEPVVNLIIGKAVLATGCTAVSLTKESVIKYMPRRIIIASCFYSKRGVSELMHEIPNADLILVGEDDRINDDGMLEPGIGNLDHRLHNECNA